MMLKNKTINWFEKTNRLILADFPEAHSYSTYLVERLSALLLERLPTFMGQELIELLPENSDPAHSTPLLASAASPENASIGYIAFVEKAAKTLGCSDLGTENDCLLSEATLIDYSEKLANSFLWAVAQELPNVVKTQLIVRLPTDLRSRMYLETGPEDYQAA
jgi:hypothetical protein